MIFPKGDYLTLLLQTATAFFLTLITTILTIKIAPRLKIMDNPQRNHPAILHHRPIARGGGIPLWIGFTLTCLLFIPLDKYIVALIIGGLINVFFGTLDDRYDLSPFLRLFITLPLSTLPILITGIHLTISNPFPWISATIFSFDWITFSLPFCGGQINLPEALILSFWIIWICNMVNWSKGASQLPGTAIIAFLTLAGVALKYQAGNPYQITTARLSIIWAGVLLAFLPFNFPPERIFPGFGGSTLIGLNLATLSILSGGKLATALIVMCVPITDMTITLWRRIKNNRNPFQGSQEHLYHLLLKLGLSKKQVIFIYWTITAILGATALFLEKSQKIFAFVIVFLLTSGVFLLSLRVLEKTRARNQKPT